MKKLITFICTTAMVMSLTACGAAAETTTQAETTGAESTVTEETTEAVTTEETVATSEATTGDADRTTLTVGFDAEFPPYGYMDDNGEYVGFDLDLAAEVCKRQGWELIKQPIDWDAKDMELSSGTIDCIWNGFTINGREDDYTWSVPYVDNSQVFVVAADSGIASKEDLAGKIVGVQKDSSALAALEDEENQENLDLAASFGELVQYSDYNTAFMDLEAGAVDAVAIDIGVANYQISSRGDSFVILDDYLSTEQYGIGFQLGNEELRDTVEATLLEMVDDGTFATIAEKYADYGLVDSVCLEKE